MTCIATYNIQIMAPGEAGEWGDDWERPDKRVLSNLPAMLEAVEEDLTKLLPPGYEARIREWSSDDE